MRILFLLHSSGTSEGSSIAALSILSQLNNRGYKLHVVCPKDGPMVQKLNDLGIDVSIIKYCRAIYPDIQTFKSVLSWPYRMVKLLILNKRAEVLLSDLVNAVKPDVIHTNVGVLRVGYYVAKKMGIPHVWHVRETAKGLKFNHYPTCEYQKKLLYYNKFNIAITQNVWDYYNMVNSNSRIVYDGVFSGKHINIPVPEKKTYFLFVGRIVKAKGPDWAIDSFLKIANKYPDYELWLAGSEIGSFATELRNKVNSTDYSQRIKFLGQRHDIYDLMSKSQAILVPSIFEGFGFITVESMLNHTIVIGRNTGGTKEQFDNGLKLTGGEIGLRCETVDDMAKHMEDIIQNGQDHYTEMIQRASETVRKLYTTENNTKQIEHIYNTITI